MSWQEANEDLLSTFIIRNIIMYAVVGAILLVASFGTYNVLWQIDACRAVGLPYLYLGYWIGESPKMAYKSRYAPIEGLIDGVWQRLDEHSAD